MKAYIPIPDETEHPDKSREAKEVIGLAKKYGIDVIDDVLDADLTISVGGDGTVLHWYRNIIKEYNVCKPILPITTSSQKSLGYISDLKMKHPERDPEKALERLSKRLYRIEKRLMLDIYKNSQKFNFAINETTITQIPTTGMKCKIHVDGKAWLGYREIPGDGFIVATANGATAYSRSAIGHLLDTSDPIQSKQMVLTLRYPIYLRSEEMRSEVIPDTSVVDFELIHPESVFLVTDNDYSMINKSDKITIKKSDDKTFNLIRIDGMEEDMKSKEKRRVEYFEKKLFPGKNE